MSTTASGSCGAFATRCSSPPITAESKGRRSEEHTSELQSRVDLVCRLLLEKKKKKKYMTRDGIWTNRSRSRKPARPSRPRRSSGTAEGRAEDLNDSVRHEHTTYDYASVATA